MTNAIYLKRHLTIDGQIIHQDEMKLSGCVVILAEPGAGKTALLQKIAESLNTVRIRANVFRNRANAPECEILILDGLDEVAKIDYSAIDSIFAKASQINPSLVVFACRASEWAAPRYKGLIKDFFGVEVTTYHLVAFNETEQRTFFQSIAPDYSFDAFYAQASSVDLNPLFGNPLFLRLFALAYVDNPHAFESKKRVYEDAVIKLVKEHAEELPSISRPNIEFLTNCAEEIFAKLLLSGSEGFSSVESHADHKFPFLYELIRKVDRSQLKYLMDTGLFKLADSPSLHEPIHRIVAEYCAASYLTKRINNNQDLFSLKRCLAIIAPSGVVRHELRGLMGWLAALGNKNTQGLVIALDPYAAIANGDPAQLHSNSKIALINALSDLAETDPYFRASDQWRSFSAKGFFTSEVVGATTSILAMSSNKNHLRGLILELLENSDQGYLFKTALINLLINTEESEHLRKLALNCLINIKGENLSGAFNILVSLGDVSSLELASIIVNERGVDHIGKMIVCAFLKTLSTLYPHRHQPFENVIGKRRFINALIESFSEEDTQWLLDQLSAQMACSCAAKNDYDCKCRSGLSKVMGVLLDRYFEVRTDRFDAGMLWQWMRNIIFHHSITPPQSKSVEVLQNTKDLRQAIHLYALGGLSDSDEILRLGSRFNGWLGHSGLFFRDNDIENIIRFSYEHENLKLWSAYFQYHALYNKDRGINELRALMRRQAYAKPEFMAKWAFYCKHERNRNKKIRADNYRFYGKHRARNDKRKKQAVDDFTANNELIRNGRHWGWINYLAGYYLYPDERAQDFDVVPDDKLIEDSLCNSIHFLEPDLPSLKKLIELRINNQVMQVEFVLCAVAVCVYRKYRTLGSLNHTALVVLKVALNRYSSKFRDEYCAIDDEVSRCLFLTDNDREIFLRNYFEPQLAAGCAYVTVDWLTSRSEFNQFKKNLPFEWLNRFPDMPFQALETLFAYCASDFEDRDELVRLIERRCYELREFQYGPPTEAQFLQRTFWFVRCFYFADKGCPSFIWESLVADPRSLFLFETYSGKWSRDESEGWPKLSAPKLFKIVDAFCDYWPEVYLPGSFGSESPESERAYRFLSGLVNKIGSDTSGHSLPILNQLIDDQRFSAFRNDALHFKAKLLKNLALRDFVAPSPKQITQFLDNLSIASVEDLRALLMEQLNDLQKYLQFAETNPLDVYYSGDKRVDENTARNRIVEFLKPRFSGLDVIGDIEKYMAAGNRCDFTAEISLNGQQHLLVVEVKGQWNKELFTAASEQLHKRYSCHPDAADQGIYLVLWFGSDEKVASLVGHGIDTPQQLKEKILEQMSAELHGKIDVFVLDLSRANGAAKPVRKRKTVKK